MNYMGNFKFVVCLNLIIMAVIFFPPISFSKDVINKFEKKVKIGNDIVTISIKSSAINTKNIDISIIETCKILPCLGGFKSDLKDHISQFNVVWNGEQIAIPKKLYTDCFTPSLHEQKWALQKEGGIQLIPGSDKKSILIIMSAWKSACCGYQIYWVIRKEGKNVRYVYDYIP